MAPSTLPSYYRRSVSRRHLPPERLPTMRECARHPAAASCTPTRATIASASRSFFFFFFVVAQDAFATKGSATRLELWLASLFFCLASLRNIFTLRRESALSRDLSAKGCFCCSAGFFMRVPARAFRYNWRDGGLARRLVVNCWDAGEEKGGARCEWVQEFYWWYGGGFF